MDSICEDMYELGDAPPVPATSPFDNELPLPMFSDGAPVCDVQELTDFASMLQSEIESSDHAIAPHPAVLTTTHATAPMVPSGNTRFLVHGTNQACEWYVKVSDLEQAMRGDQKYTPAVHVSKVYGKFHPDKVKAYVKKNKASFLKCMPKLHDILSKGTRDNILSITAPEQLLNNYPLLKQDDLILFLRALINKYSQNHRSNTRRVDIKTAREWMNVGKCAFDDINDFKEVCKMLITMGGTKVFKECYTSSTRAGKKSRT